LNRDANVRTNESINFETISSVEMAHNPIFIWLVDLCLYKVKEEGVEGVMVFKHNGVNTMVLTIRSSGIITANFAKMELLSLRKGMQMGGGVASQVILESANSGVSYIIVHPSKGGWRSQVTSQEVDTANVTDFTTTARVKMKYRS
jgi:hypothetical protein